MLGSLILYFKGMRIMIFQLSGFYYRGFWSLGASGLRIGFCKASLNLFRVLWEGDVIR